MASPFDVAVGDIRTSPFERPSFVLSNLTEGDVEAAIRGALSPQTLSPTQRRNLAEQWGLKKPGERGVYAAILDSISNPMVLIGAVLALRYPIPTAQNMLRYAEKLTGLQRRVGPLLRNIGSIDDIYAGMSIPEDYKRLLREVDMFRRTHSDKIKEHILKFERDGGKFDRRTQLLLSAKLDGLDQPRGPGKKHLHLFKPIDLGPGFDRMYKSIRADLDEMYSSVFGDPEKGAHLAFLAKRGQVVEAVRNRKKGARSKLAQLEAHYFDTSQPVHLANYWPHQITRDSRKFANESAELIRRYKRGDIAAKQHIAASLRVTTKRSLSRHHRMLPSPKELEPVQDLLLPGSLEKVKSVVKDYRPAYSLEFMPVMSSYIHSLARAHGWTNTGLGSKLALSVEQLRLHDPVRAAMMESSYIPLALGRQTFDQAMKASRWYSDKIKIMDWLKSDASVAKYVPTGMKDWLVKNLEEERGIFSGKNISGRLAGYLYLSTLGANPVPAAYNLMQLLLTTVPTIGWKNTAAGLKSVWEKAPSVFRARRSGKSFAEALKQSFPEFAEQGLVADPVTDDAVLRALNQAWEVSLSVPKIAGRKVDQIRSAMMSLFQSSEALVRLSTFEGARLKALADKHPDPGFFARRVTEITQFLGGPANAPSRIKEWNPLLRQFLQFPMRTLGFTVGPATEMGSGTQAGLLGRNWGTLGRMMLASGAAYEVGQNVVGQDWTHGLLFGALPVPSGRGPLAALPLVPPAVGIGAAAVQDLVMGEFDQTRYALPLLFPGGLAAAKLSGVLAPDVAQVLGRGYADYQAKGPDGRVPVYTKDGTLRGHMTPTEMWLETLGIQGGDPTGQKEKDLAAYLLAQRDRIRGFRKQYVDALLLNDSRKAAEIRRAYEQVYPGQGGLTVRPQELEAAQTKQTMTRLEKLLMTLPPEVRPQFAQAISMTMMDQADKFMGIDPIFLAAPMTQDQRNKYRRPPAQDAVGALQDKLLRSKQILGGFPSSTAGPTGQAPKPKTSPTQQGPFGLQWRSEPFQP